MAAKSTKSAINDLPKLSAPAHRALAGAGLFTLKQISKKTEADLLKLHGFGPTGIVALRAALAAKGLSFAEPKKKK